MKLEIVFEDGRKEIFDGVASFNVTEEKTANNECHEVSEVETPTEGKLFKVNPLGIDRSIFEKRMKDQRQEYTRQIIQEAFAEVDKQPKKYATPFDTMVPKKKWEGCKSVEELKKYAKTFGGYMADWVEQALEWAQRISNGERWEDICDNADTANWYRMIVWKNGCYRIVGGSHDNFDIIPASDVHSDDCFCFYSYYDVVPLVALKKK